mgnify:CR=1 FL=1
MGFGKPQCKDRATLGVVVASGLPLVQDGDVQRRVDVRIGVEAEDRVEIREGVEEGQTIVGP